MELIVGILLIIVACIFTVTVSPMLITAGVMGGYDDSNIKLRMRILAWIVIGAGIIIPTGLFLTGFYILF